MTAQDSCFKKQLQKMFSKWNHKILFFRRNQLYISIYVTWMYLVFMYVLPFVSLIVLNYLIFLAMRKANATRARLSSQEKKEHNLAHMLLMVVVVFFVCNLLALVINILELFDLNYDLLIKVSNLLVTVNSSINIFIYCTFGNKFKTVFMQIFCGKKPETQTRRFRIIYGKSKLHQPGQDDSGGSDPTANKDDKNSLEVQRTEAASMSPSPSPSYVRFEQESLFNENGGNPRRTNDD